jgi:uncharacterized membrane protein
MGAQTALIASVLGFVGFHFLLSHPLRAGLIARLGEKAYSGIYSLIALAFYVAIILAYRAADPWPLYATPQWAYGVVSAVMLFACVLLVGSLTSSNPALPAMGDQAATKSVAGTVFAITRHPMMWGIGLWGLSHLAASGDGNMALVGGGMAVLALLGARLQDGRKAREVGAGWVAYQQRSSFVPFGMQLGGQLPWSSVWPGFLPVVGGVSLFVVLMLLHTWAFGVTPLPGR